MTDGQEQDFGMSADVGKLAEALAKAQAAMRHANKDSLNPHFKSRYADLAGVIDACREPLANNGLSVSQMPSFAAVGVRLRTMLLHTSGQYLWSTLTIPVRKQDAQGIGSALTYARRYSLSAIVGIAQDDDDGNAAARPVDDNRAPPRPSNPPPSPRRNAVRVESKADGASATKKLLQYVHALDKCESVADVMACREAWSSTLDELPRGKQYVDAYEEHKLAGISDEHMIDAGKFHLVEAINAMKEATRTHDA